MKEASKSVTSLESLLDLDVEKNCVKTGGSRSRNLLRVKRGLDMIRVLFENIIAEEYVSHPFICSFIFLYFLVNCNETVLELI